jgi:acyl-homoserine lactone acylase PvdQ
VGRQDVTEQWIEKTQVFLRSHGYALDTTGVSQQRPAGPKFSHAWVADGRFSGTGSAVLVSMPQTSVANPSLFYEFHVRGKTFDARGVGVAGSPIILIGWNPHVAWGMTALGADQADLFRLETDGEHLGQYQFDGEWRQIHQRSEEIKVKDGRPQTLVIRETHFGPIVNEFAFARPDEPLVALKRIPICDAGHDTITGALAMLRARNVKQFMAALGQWRFPTANVIVGDQEGNIGYSTVGALPLRSSLAPENGGAAQDGSASKFDWQAIIPPDLVPQVINPKQGYLFSGNHRPVGAFYPIPLGVSTGSMGDSMRSWRIRQLFDNKKSMTEQQLLEMYRDSTNPARQALIRIGFHLRDALKQPLRDEAEAALKHLETWYANGAPSRLNVPGAELATLINTQFRFINTDLAFMYGGGESGMSHFLKTVNRRLDQDPNAKITPLEKQYVERLLVGAWKTAENKWGPELSQWNVHAREEVTQRKMAYHGSLDGFPSLDAAHDLAWPPLECVDGATVFSQAAQAYVQWVPLAHVDDARSLLPPGPTESPDSPTYTVNVEAWVKGKLHPAPLSREALEPFIRSRKQVKP